MGGCFSVFRVEQNPYNGQQFVPNFGVQGLHIKHYCESLIATELTRINSINELQMLRSVVIRDDNGNICEVTHYSHPRANHPENISRLPIWVNRSGVNDEVNILARNVFRIYDEDRHGNVITRVMRYEYGSIYSRYVTFLTSEHVRYGDVPRTSSVNSFSDRSIGSISDIIISSSPIDSSLRDSYLSNSSWESGYGIDSLFSNEFGVSRSSGTSGDYGLGDLFV